MVKSSLKLKTSSIFFLSLIQAFIAVLLDFIFHATSTSPKETTTYFLVKFLLVGFLGFWVWKKFTHQRAILFTGIFVVLFGFYYRATELFYNAPFSSRVPEIMLFGKIITYYDNPILSVVTWGIVHGLAFLIGIYIPYLVIKWWKK